MLRRDPSPPGNAGGCDQYLITSLDRSDAFILNPCKNATQLQVTFSPFQQSMTFWWPPKWNAILGSWKRRGGSGGLSRGGGRRFWVGDLIGCWAQTHPEGWCTGRGHCLPPCQNCLTLFRRRESRVTHPTAPPNLYPPSLSVSYSPPPGLLLTQMGEHTHTPDEGWSLLSPAHGQGSLELPQRTTAPLAEDTNSHRAQREGRHRCDSLPD